MMTKRKPSAAPPVRFNCWIATENLSETLRPKSLESIAVIDISPKTQNLIDELIASGRFSNREEVVDAAVRLLNVDLEHDRNVSKYPESSAQQWCEELEAWAASHRPLPREADDSRESIY